MDIVKTLDKLSADKETTPMLAEAEDFLKDEALQSIIGRLSPFIEPTVKGLNDFFAKGEFIIVFRKHGDGGAAFIIDAKKIKSFELTDKSAINKAISIKDMFSAILDGSIIDIVEDIGKDKK